MRLSCQVYFFKLCKERHISNAILKWLGENKKKIKSGNRVAVPHILEKIIMLGEDSVFHIFTVTLWALVFIIFLILLLLASLHSSNSLVMSLTHSHKAPVFLINFLFLNRTLYGNKLWAKFEETVFLLAC